MKSQPSPGRAAFSRIPEVVGGGSAGIGEDCDRSREAADAARGSMIPQASGVVVG